MRKNKGITLIALVITIIVLLILAGISIATLTGANGVLTKASTAKEETKKAEYKEALELIGNGLKPEKVLENLSTKEFMDRYEEELRERAKQKGSLEGVRVERKSDEKIWVTTQEGYIYEITENEVKLLGKKGENLPPDLQQTDIEFKLTPNGYTNQNVTVEIIPQISTEGFTLQYSINEGENWSDYKTPIILEENVTIYTKLVNNLEEEGAVATKEIDIIDRDSPSATFSVNPEQPSFFRDFQITVNRKDKESGVAPSYTMFLSKSAVVGENTSASTVSGSSTLNSVSENFAVSSPGIYYCHAIIYDKAGNSSEVVSDPIVVGNGNVSITTRVKGYKIDVKATMPEDVKDIAIASLSIEDIGSYNGNSYTFDVKQPGTYTVRTVLTNNRVIETIVEVPYYEETNVFAYLSEKNIGVSDFFTLSSNQGDNDPFIYGMIGAGNSNGANQFWSYFDVPYTKLNAKNMNYSEIYAVGRFDSGSNTGGCFAEITAFYKDGTHSVSNRAGQRLEWRIHGL